MKSLFVLIAALFVISLIGLTTAAIAEEESDLDVKTNVHIVTPDSK